MWVEQSRILGYEGFARRRWQPRRQHDGHGTRAREQHRAAVGEHFSVLHSFDGSLLPFNFSSPADFTCTISGSRRMRDVLMHV